MQQQPEVSFKRPHLISVAWQAASARRVLYALTVCAVVSQHAASATMSIRIHRDSHGKLHECYRNAPNGKRGHGDRRESRHRLRSW